jgi:hypothetical protein
MCMSVCTQVSLAGGGRFVEVGNWALDLLDSLVGPLSHVRGDALRPEKPFSDNPEVPAPLCEPLETRVAMTFRAGCSPQQHNHHHSSPLVGTALFDFSPWTNHPYQVQHPDQSNHPSLGLNCSTNNSSNSNSNSSSPDIDVVTLNGLRGTFQTSLLDPFHFTGDFSAAVSPVVSGALTGSDHDASGGRPSLSSASNLSVLQPFVDLLRSFFSRPSLEPAHPYTSASAANGSEAGPATHMHGVGCWNGDMVVPTAADALRTARVVDAVLRQAYRGRDDAFWLRPETFEF